MSVRRWWEEEKHEKKGEAREETRTWERKKEKNCELGVFG